MTSSITCKKQDHKALSIICVENSHIRWPRWFDVDIPIKFDLRSWLWRDHSRVNSAVSGVFVSLSFYPSSWGCHNVSLLSVILITDNFILFYEIKLSQFISALSYVLRLSLESFHFTRYFPPLCVVIMQIYYCRFYKLQNMTASNLRYLHIYAKTGMGNLSTHSALGRPGSGRRGRLLLPSWTNDAAIFAYSHITCHVNLVFI